ncbi:MAG: B12-binding domain-containing radical SAM protein [Promethearchaeota archaeon]
MKTRILFIYPPVNKETIAGEKKNLIKYESWPIELSFAYLDSFIKEKMPDIESEYLDFRCESPDDLEGSLYEVKNSFNFNVVAITCYSRHYLSTLKLCTLVKKLDNSILTIVGGFHPTVRPKDFIFKGSPVNFVVRGEGEIALYKIIRKYLENPSIALNENVIVEKNEKIDINELPLINLELFRKYEKMLNFKQIYVYFSRGCINECSFCIAKSSTCGLKRYRTLKPCNVRKQLSKMEQYDPEKIVIQDPIFGVNPKWYDEVVSILGSREGDYRVKIETHVDLLNQRKINHLFNNKIDLTIGFESASHRMLYLMNKTTNPRRYVERTNEILKMFANSSQELVLNVLLGHPGELDDSITDTFGFLESNREKMNNVVVKFSLFRYYPGTTIEKHINFFKKIFGTRIYAREWWHLPMDHSILPSLIDPSRILTLNDELSVISKYTENFIKDIVYKNKDIGMLNKLFYLQYLSRIKRTYQELEIKVKDLRENLSENKDLGLKIPLKNPDLISNF